MVVAGYVVGHDGGERDTRTVTVSAAQAAAAEHDANEAAPGFSADDLAAKPRRPG